MAITYRYLFPNSRSSRYQYYAPIWRGDDIIILLYVIYDLTFSEYVLNDTVCEKLLMFNQPSFIFDYVKIELNNYNRVRQLLFTVWIVTGSNQWKQSQADEYGQVYHLMTAAYFIDVELLTNAMVYNGFEVD